MKKIMVKLCVAVLVVSMSLGMFAACANGGTQMRAEATTFVSLSINPEVEFTVSSDNKVMSVNAVNEDAEIVLAGTNFVGMEVEVAAEKFVALCVETGYLDVSKQSETKLTVIDENSEVTDKIENSIGNCLNGYFDNNGIFCNVSNATFDEYASQAEQLGVSVGHMKMILRAIDLNPEMTLEDLSKMPINELVELIHVGHGNNVYAHAIKDQLRIDRDALRVKYSELFTLVDESIVLEGKIATFTGTAEEKAVLVSELATKNARINVLKVAFEADLKALNDQAKIDSEVCRGQNRMRRDEMIEGHRGHMNSHGHNFNNNQQKIKNEINNWRKGLAK